MHIGSILSDQSAHHGDILGGHLEFGFFDEKVLAGHDIGRHDADAVAGGLAVT